MDNQQSTAWPAHSTSRY